MYQVYSHDRIAFNGTWSFLIPGLSTCVEGDIRLSGGLSPREGMVEMCVDGRFVLLVQRGSSGWTERTTFVACRQLQLPPSSKQCLIY